MKDVSIKLKNLKARYFHFYLYCKWFPETKELLRRNEQYKNKYKGERCFILGNGPSLKTEDLSLLRDEYVFTVNQAVRLPQFKDIKSTFHVWADGNFFKIDKNKPEDMEQLNVMLSVGDENPEVQCFFPIDQHQFIKEFDIDKKINTNYFLINQTFYDDYNNEFDLTKPIPVFHAVVLYCISMAVYMGFSEIYLLGCDNTGIIVNIKSFLHENDNDDYGYDVSENDKKRMEAMLEKAGVEAYLESHLLATKNFRRLYKYCSDRNIKLVNCSSQTVIDSIPRKRMIDVLQNKY